MERISERGSLSKEKERTAKAIYVFVGPEGSGKTTHAQFLAEKLGIPKLTMGDEFRQIWINIKKN